MTERTEKDTGKSTADEALAQQPLANPEAGVEADLDDEPESAATPASAQEGETDAAI